MDQHQSDPGSPWLINTWLLLITSVHMHSRSSMRKKKKTERKKKGVCDLQTGVGLQLSLWSTSLSVKANAGTGVILPLQNSTQSSVNGIFLPNVGGR